MAFLELNLFSDVLKMDSSINVIIPEIWKENEGREFREFKKDYPVLYLLHGLSDDHSAWLRKSTIETQAEKAGIAVIMPNVHRSFYTNMVQGPNYFSYLTEELPRKMKKLFPISSSREKTFVAGLSMGGYGAFKLALNNPKMFSAAASLSGVLNIVGRLKNEKELGDLYQELKWIYGDSLELKNSKHDLFYLLKKLKEKGREIPDLYQCCGTEDFLYQDNLKFKNYCRKNEIKLKYSEEKAAHEWWYWDQQIKDVIDWLPL